MRAILNAKFIPLDSQESNHKATPLHIASSFNHFTCAQLLINAGATDSRKEKLGKDAAFSKTKAINPVLTMREKSNRLRQAFNFMQDLTEPQT